MCLLFWIKFLMETFPITYLITLAFNVDAYHQSHYILFDKVFNSAIHNKRGVSYHPLLCCSMSNYTCHVLRNPFFFLGEKWGYLDSTPKLFKYLTIPSSVYSPLISHTLSYYREESLRGGPKMLVRDFESRILWIS